MAAAVAHVASPGRASGPSASPTWSTMILRLSIASQCPSRFSLRCRTTLLLLLRLISQPRLVSLVSLLAFLGVLQRNRDDVLGRGTVVAAIKTRPVAVGELAATRAFGELCAGRQGEVSDGICCEVVPAGLADEARVEGRILQWC